MFKDKVSAYITELAVAKESLPDFLQIEGSLETEVVDSAPWSAFNTRSGIRQSKIFLDKAAGLTSFDLKHLAYHEVYGGYHTELSIKSDCFLQQ